MMLRKYKKIIMAAGSGDGNQEYKEAVQNAGTREAADGNSCIALDEKALISMHGLDPALPVMCDLCSIEFHDLEQFDVHMATHRETRMFFCQLCNNTYKSWGNLVAHRKACHHGQVLSCDACGERKFHPDLGPVNFPVQNSPIGCEECGEGVTTLSQLYRHYRGHGTHHLMTHKADLTKVSLPDQIAEHLEHSPDGYRCHDCDQQFPKWEQMTEHVQKEHNCPDEMLKCSTCSQSWPAGKKFLNHYRNCCLSEDRAKSHVNTDCPICHKRFSQPSALDRHLKLHNPLNNNYHICEVCGQVITRRDRILGHARRHYGNELPDKYRKLEHLLPKQVRKCRTRIQKSFICEYCGREFSQKLNLQLHVRRHTGDRPYGCQLCGKSFYTKQQLAIHIRHHTGERPYACSVCPKTFTGPTALYTHRQLHDEVKKYLCHHCGVQFFWKSSYLGHIRLHTGERPYPCTICNRAFTLRGKLNKHMRIHASEHTILGCSDCGEKFGSEAELNAHRDDQCRMTMVTFVEEQPTGEKDTRVIIMNTEDLEHNKIDIDDIEMVKL